MIVSKTPLRFSLIGGGSDLPAYWKNYGPCEVISMALDVYMYVTLHFRSAYRQTPSDWSLVNPYGSRIRVSYTKTENVDGYCDLKHDLIRATFKLVAEYPGSVAKEKADILRDLLDCEVTTICDIPSRGSGLGSSASLLVGLFRAIYPQDTPMELVEDATCAEIEILERPVGWQDPLVAAYGGLKKYHIDSLGFVTVTDLSYAGEKLARHLLAFRLPPSRSQSADTSPKHDTLEAMREHMASRAVDLTKTVQMVPDFMACLTGEDPFEDIGRLLEAAWYFKKQSHDYCDPMIDQWHDAGIKAGALGGKVSGSLSGGTGHLFFFCEPGFQGLVREAMPKELVELRVGFSPNGSIAIEL